MNSTIPSETKIYLRRDQPYTLYLKPDVNLQNQQLIVKYDYRLNGVTLIPRGSKVICEWLSESEPFVSAHLSLNSICLNGALIDISAVSGDYQNVSYFNDAEVSNAPFLYNIMTEKSVSNKTRRIVEVNCRTKILYDRDVNTPYIEIPTNEIVVTLDDDLVL